MEHICLDLEGVLVPEIWAEVAKHTGQDKFKLTTQDVKRLFRVHGYEDGAC